jgi:predicted DNA-binding protein (MmcQ/YjbR family)
VTREEIEAFAMGLPAVTQVVQWGGSDVYKVGGKVFAMCHPSGGLSFKVSQIGFMVLTEDGPGRQAPYCAKGQWVNLDLDGAPDEDLQDWLRTAHSLIAAKLTKKARTELGLT